ILPSCPHGSRPYWNDAYNDFRLFWPESIWDTLADNTNSYARAQGAIEEFSADKANRRKWYRTNADELKGFVGICIYLGLFPTPMTELWSTDDESGPVHPIPHHMKQTRFFQLGRFFHISGSNQDQPSQNGTARTRVRREVKEEEEEEEEDWPENDSEFDEAPDMPELNAEGDGEVNSDDVATILSPDEHRWWHKVESLASTFREACRSCWVPGSNVAIDEMNICCHGCSSETFKAPKKPIKKGYRMWAMCEVRYLLWSMYSSRKDGIGELCLQAGLSATGSLVVQFGDILPKQVESPYPSTWTITSLRNRFFGLCATEVLVYVEQLDQIGKNFHHYCEHNQDKQNAAEGNAAEGNAVEGNVAEENAAEENAAEGNAAEGTAAEGNAAEGNAAEVTVAEGNAAE
ncbi:hypothetical protein MMC07_008525, partial [Pseudocyphellaria aurata]|nr:hypothetical protein [Pseudocyphellaria aurata]